MSMFGLHRRLRGAIVGHLALFEMTSSIPNRRYADGLRRLGVAPTRPAFFDEHVVADAVHENVAAVDLAGGLAAPGARGSSRDILWGAAALRRARRPLRAPPARAGTPARARCVEPPAPSQDALRRRRPRLR